MTQLLGLPLQAKKARGERTGSIPYGYQCDANNNLVADDREQAAIAAIMEMNSRGMSLRNIATRLDRLGFIPRGKVWHSKTIWSILKGAA